VKFTNILDTEKSYDKSFSRFLEATAGTITPGGSDETTLVASILKELMDDIYNEAFASW